MTVDVMLDLETLGDSPGCVVLSIGAAAFNDAAILSTFEARIDARSCQRAGLTINADCVMWWLRQDQAARDALLQAPVVPLHDALTQFADWLSSLGGCVHLWSQGPSFDAAVLGVAYRAAGLPVPWKYWNERCVRTILDLTGIHTRDFHQPGDVPHAALSDALVQARAVQEALRRVRSQRAPAPTAPTEAATA
jgi:3' exoribonuclease, RNase T-like